MKWELKQGDYGVSFLLSTDRPLPRMFDGQFLKRSAYSLGDVLHRTSPQWRLRYARHIARRNRGKMQFELVEPARDYYELLLELAAIDGIVEIQDLNRYSLLIHYGRLFEPVQIGQAIGSAISRKLYPDEPLVFAGESESHGSVNAAVKGQSPAEVPTSP